MAGTPQGYPPQQGGHPQQQPHGQQGGYGPPVKPHRGGMLIAFAILSWFVCVIFGIVAFVMARTDMREMEQGIMDRQGEGLTKAAYWVSIANFIFVAVILVLYVFLFVLVLGSGAASTM